MSGRRLLSTIILSSAACAAQPPPPAPLLTAAERAIVVVEGSDASTRLRTDCTSLGLDIGTWDVASARREAVERGADTVQKILASTTKREENHLKSESRRWAIHFWLCAAGGAP